MIYVINVMFISDGFFKKRKKIQWNNNHVSIIEIDRGLLMDKTHFSMSIVKGFHNLKVVNWVGFPMDWV